MKYRCPFCYGFDTDSALDIEIHWRSCSHAGDGLQADLFNPPEPARFDPVAGTVGREEGIRRADDHAYPVWRDRALDAIEETCRTLRHFTSDDVWKRLPGTRENRALGPLMLVAARNGWCFATPEYLLTEQKSRHRAPIRVWESLLH